MNEFGAALRTLRQQSGMRQQDLVETLQRVIARSTLANVEVGRERPSARLWAAIESNRPDWVEQLRPHLTDIRHRFPATVPGPFEIIRAHSINTFRDDRAPEEVIHVRRVRALAETDAYVMRLVFAARGFSMETEALYGGWIESEEHEDDGGSTLVVSRLRFDHTLKRGEVWEFATRSWVRRDQVADKLCFVYSRPVEQAGLSVNFTGPRPSSVWRVGPVDELDDFEDAAGPGEPLALSPGGGCSLQVSSPQLDKIYGLAWRW